MYLLFHHLLYVFWYDNAILRFNFVDQRINYLKDIIASVKVNNIFSLLKMVKVDSLPPSTLVWLTVYWLLLAGKIIIFLSSSFDFVKHLFEKMCSTCFAVFLWFMKMTEAISGDIGHFLFNALNFSLWKWVWNQYTHWPELKLFTWHVAPTGSFIYFKELKHSWMTVDLGAEKRYSALLLISSSDSGASFSVQIFIVYTVIESDILQKSEILILSSFQNTQRQTERNEQWQIKHEEFSKPNVIEYFSSLVCIMPIMELQKF